MKALFFSILIACLMPTTGFFLIPVKDSNGDAINLSSYEGKKILIVNIATGSEQVSQLAGLQQLQQQYAGSLAVIAVPSYSFGHEPRTAAQVKLFCEQTYQTSFLITELAAVNSYTRHPLFTWLTTASQNGVTDAPVTTDFQKFLVSPQGELIGMFAASVMPLDPQLTNAITTAQ